jgi:hypothetical protein
MGHLVVLLETGGGRKKIYPEKAIYEAGLDQKPENFLHAFRRATPSKLCTHGSAVFPVNGGRALVYLS